MIPTVDAIGARSRFTQKSQLWLRVENEGEEGTWWATTKTLTPQSHLLRMLIVRLLWLSTHQSDSIGGYNK